MDVPNKYRLDHRVLTVTALTERYTDREYWLSKTPAERFEALEVLRQIAYGYDPATDRLQRVLEVAELNRS